jgi:hypothetical protein
MTNNYENELKKLIVTLGDLYESPEKLENLVLHLLDKINQHPELRTFSLNLIFNCVLSLPMKTVLYAVVLKLIYPKDPSFVKEILMKVLKSILCSKVSNLNCFKRSVQFIFQCFSLGLVDLSIVESLSKIIIEFAYDETYIILLLCLTESIEELIKQNIEFVNITLSKIENFFKSNSNRRLLIKYRTIFKDEDNTLNYDFSSIFISEFMSKFNTYSKSLIKSSIEYIENEFFSKLNIKNFIYSRFPSEFCLKITEKCQKSLLNQQDFNDLKHISNVLFEPTLLGILSFSMVFSPHFQVNSSKINKLDLFIYNQYVSEIIDTLAENGSLRLAVNYLLNSTYFFNLSLVSTEDSSKLDLEVRQRILSEAILRYLFKIEDTTSQTTTTSNSFLSNLESFNLSKPLICGSLTSEINKSLIILPELLVLINNLIEKIDDIEIIPQKKFIKFIAQLISNNLSYSQEIVKEIFSRSKSLVKENLDNDNNEEQGVEDTRRVEFLKLLVSYLYEYVSPDKFKEHFEEDLQYLLDGELMNSNDISSIDTKKDLDEMLSVRNNPTMLYFLGILKDEILNKKDFSAWDETLPYHEDLFINNLFVILFTVKSKTLSHIRECLNTNIKVFIKLVNNTKRQLQVLRCLFICWGKSTAHVKLIVDFLLTNYIVEHSLVISYLIEYFKELSFSDCFISMDFLEFIINHASMFLKLLERKVESERKELKNLSKENNNELELISDSNNNDNKNINNQGLIQEKINVIEKLDENIEKLVKSVQKLPLETLLKLLDLTGNFIKTRNDNVDISFNYLVDFVFIYKSNLSKHVKHILQYFDKMNIEEKSEIMEEFVYGLDKMI